jgi:hypothetical protein
MEFKTKRTINTVIIAILIFSGIFFGVYKIRGLSSSFSKTTALEIVPTDAALVIQAKDAATALQQMQNNSFWQEVASFEIASALNSSLSFFDSVVGENTVYKEMANKKAYVSFHLIGIDQIQPVFYFSLSKHGIKQVASTIEETLAEKGSVVERKYENHTVYDASVLSTKEKFSFSSYNGCFFISPSSILIENAIRQLNSGFNLFNNKGFRDIWPTAGHSSDANIFINHNSFPNSASVAFNPDHKNKIRKSGQIAEWSALDLTLKKDLALLNGFSYVCDSLNYILNILKGQNPQRFVSHEIYPAQVYSFYTLLIDNKEIFKTQYTEYLRRDNALHPYNAFFKNMEKKYGTDLEKIFYDAWEREIGTFHFTANPNKTVAESFFVLQTKGKNAAHASFMEFIEKFAREQGMDISRFVHNYKMDEGASYEIYKFPVDDIFEQLFGVFFDFPSANYFTWINNFMVFGESIESLKQVIYANVLNKTLDKSLEYSDFSEYVNTRSNLYYYLKLPRSEKLVAKYFNPTLQKLYTDNKKSFDNINTLAYQLGNTDKWPYNNITLNYVNQTYDIPITEWETLLDTVIDFKPVLVENHYTRNYEIFVQDLKNNMYLINNSGRIVWKQKLDEPINSEVYQVDYYKNGKLQLLFSTANSLHLIDRNGNYVERYPVRLRSSATAGMALFDYDQNKDYRIFIPCNNKQVYAYSLEGKLITGWDFDKTDHEVTQPVQHFRVGQKDYIVFADKYKVYIVDRRGNTRVSPEKQFAKSPHNSFQIGTNNGREHWVTTDTAGTVYYIYVNGKVETQKIAHFDEHHFFDYNDVDADGKKDFIYVNNGKLSVYNHNGNENFVVDLHKRINARPIYFQFSSTDRKLGVVDKASEKIYLINNNGKVYDGFPLIGNSLYTIGILKNNYGKFNLIVGGRNNYLYNYAVN